MASRPTAIKISSRLIEFEDHIIRVPSIASITIGRDPIRLRWGLLLCAIGVGLILVIVTLAPGEPYYQPQARSGPGVGTLGLWTLAMGCLASGVVLMTRQALFISLADSKVTMLVDRNPQFMRDVMMRIREAILAGEESHVIYQVNVQAERIERIDASQTSIEVTGSPGAAVVAGDAVEARLATLLPAPAAQPPLATAPAAAALPPVEQMLDQVLARSGRARGQAPQPTGVGMPPPITARSAESVATPAAMPSTPEGGPVSQPVMPPAGAVTSIALQHAPGAIAVGGSVHQSRLETEVHLSPIADLDLLMQVLAQQNVAHHQQLNAYLALVRDHLAGGGTPRDQAIGYWRWFTDYALASLTGVEGVLALVERIGRVLTSR